MAAIGDRLVTVNAILTVRERATIKKLAADLDRRQQEVMAELVRRGLAALEAEESKSAS